MAEKHLIYQDLFNEMDRMNYHTPEGMWFYG